VPKIFNLRSGLRARDATSNSYDAWRISDSAGSIIAGPAVVNQFLATFKDDPPSQRAASLSGDQRPPPETDSAALGLAVAKAVTQAPLAQRLADSAPRTGRKAARNAARWVLLGRHG